MCWKEFEVYCIGFGEVRVVICGWIAVVLDEQCFEAEGGLVFPPVVNQSEGCYTLRP